MSTKLDTEEAVLEWAVSQGPVERDWGMEMGEDTETAAYIAESIRVREAFDRLCADGTFTAAVKRLVYDAAMKGGKP